MSLSPTQAAALMRRCRDAVAARVIPARHLAVFDYLLWRARRPGMAQCQVSLAAIARNLHLRRAEIVEALRGFERLGWLRKTRTRVRVAWQGLWASRQGTNVYTFIAAAPAPRTEFRGGPTIREEVSKEGSRGCAGTNPALDHALGNLARALGVLPRSYPARK